MDQATPVATYQPGVSRKQATISQQNAMRHSGVYGGADAIDWVYDAINLYADPASTADYRLEDKDGNKLVRAKTDGLPPEYKVGPAELYALLDKPNPYMLYDELMSLLVIDLLLVGNAYWFKWQTTATGQPAALYRLAPGYVKIVPDQYGPKLYEYQPPGATKKLEITPDKLIHFRRPNPNNTYYGLGVVQAAGRSMDIEVELTETVASYYGNRADPSIIVQSDRRVPRDVFNKLRAQLRARSSGSHRAGEMLVLEAGLTASTLSKSASDSLLSIVTDQSRDRIYSHFRANPKLFGLDSAASSSDKISDIRAEFNNEALRPFFKKLSEKITDALGPSYGDVKYLIDYRTVLPAEDALAVAQGIAVIPGIKVREVRRQLAQFGIDESTGNDKIDELVLNKPTPEMGPDGQIVDPITGKRVPNQGADQPLAGEAGRPPKGQNTVAMGSGKSLEQTIQELEGLSQREKNHAILASRAGVPFEQPRSLDETLAILEAKALLDRPDLTKVRGGLMTNEVAPPDRFAIARDADVSAAANYIESALISATTDLERGLLDHVEGKALKTSDLVARVRNSPSWKNFQTTVEQILLEGARRGASSGVIHSGLTPDGDVDYDSIAKMIANRPDGVRGIVKTLKDRVVASVKDARVSNAERDDYSAAIKAEITKWATGQAGLIAETEAVHGYNEGTLTVAEMAGLTHVFVTDGNDDDEPCVEANGSLWDIGHARENRLEHPRCRRAFLPAAMPEAAVS